MQTKEVVLGKLEEAKKEIYRMGDEFFSCPELGFREVETGRKIMAYLEQWGVPYERDIAQTGILVTLGQGKEYHIAFVADIDALPAKTGGGNVHSCGHSIQTTMGLSIIKALQEAGWVEESDGRVSVFFTPAEEFIDFAYRDGLIAQGKLEFRSGKQNMIALGYFDDVDCVLSAHANGEKEMKFDIGSTLAGFMAKKAIFHGTASHSGAAPHLGRNSLHGGILAMQAISFLKDQFPPEAGLRLNPVITEGGGDVNIIPHRTAMETYIRANDKETLEQACLRFDGCIAHSAKMLEVEYEIEDTAGYLPLCQSKALNQVVKENMSLFCAEDEILENPVSGASGDVGDLSFLLPAVQFGFSGIEGQFHNDNFAIADQENVYIRATQVMLGTIYDLLMNAQTRVYALDYAKKKEMYLRNLREKTGKIMHKNLDIT